MLVKDIMQTDIACCDATAIACAAAEILWDRDCGALPVLGSNGQVIGRGRVLVRRPAEGIAG